MRIEILCLLHFCRPGFLTIHIPPWSSLDLQGLRICRSQRLDMGLKRVMWVRRYQGQCRALRPLGHQGYRLRSYKKDQPLCSGYRGVPLLLHSAFLLFAAIASHSPWSARTHHPPTMPVSPRHMHCAPHSFSLSYIKRGCSGRLVILYPPPGSNPPLQDRRGVVFPLSYEQWLSASRAPIFATPPWESSPVRHIAFRMGVCSAACRGTVRRPRAPGPLA